MRNVLLAAVFAIPAVLPAQAPAPSAPASTAPDSAIVRGLYVNRFAAQSAKKMRSLIAIADSTEVNALIIDIKDEFGLNYASSDSSVSRNAGRAGVIPNLKTLLDTLRAHHILSVARIVVFKDSVTARVNPEWTIRKPDGSLWRDKKGMAWVNPYHQELWDYNIKVAEEAVRLGFGEVQFDYIRFPEPYKTLPPQVFPAQGTQTKEQALAEFLKLAHARISKLGVRTTADIFGLVTTVPGALEVGQQWEHLAPVADVLLPMVYPSHYPSGSFDIRRPNAEPYKIVHAAVQRAHERNAKLGLAGERVRPWLQAFTLGAPAYGAEEVKAQKQAVYDSGYDGWVLWNPGSHYDAVLGALEKAMVSRKKAFVAPAPTTGTGAPVRKVARP
ncbi:MAG: putative glycoside hydrolase [Gemmatimonadales bacterium]